MSLKTPLKAWLNALTSAAAANTLVKAKLGKPTPAAGALKSVDVRPILVKRVYKLSFTYHNKTNDVVKNYSPDEAATELTKLMNNAFTSAQFTTTSAEHRLSKEGNAYIHTTHTIAPIEAPSLAHDKPKNHRFSATSNTYMHGLGLTDANGTVLKSASDKMRQIQKYIEVLDGLLTSVNFPNHKPLKVLDMGAGKGYLTFALYDHLVNTRKQPAQVVGIEFRADLVALCNTIAKDAGFSGLKFTEGTIEHADCTDAQVVIALHACDTATDDALAKAVQAGAQLVVVAPCCHKQIRRQLKAPQGDAPMASVLAFGTYQERFAEMLTDTLRSQLLEAHNYTTNVFEFIGGEHTPKNVMITAIKNAKPLAAAKNAALLNTIATTKATFGITAQRLEDVLRGHRD